MAKRVLVTGACGFIGSHLAEELVRQGYAVRALVQYNSLGRRGWLDDTPADLLEGMEIVASDIRDPFAVRELVHGCDTVFHLAALIAIPHSYSAPHAYVETNINGTLNVLQAAVASGVGRIIHTSTSEVYGSAQCTPMTEEHPLKAQSPYAATKIAADQLALSFQRSFDAPVVVVRPFNTYGPRQSARAVIPTIITQLAAGLRRIRLGALAPQRDFNFVRDTVRGFIAAQNAPELIGEVVNVCSGYAASIGDTFHLIRGIMGVEAEVEEDAQRLRPAASEVDCLLGDSSKMRRLSGWAPRREGRDGLRQGLEETVAWFGRPGSLDRYRPAEYAR
jgi:dTDP-glucose 4,6-dehydratase